MADAMSGTVNLGGYKVSKKGVMIGGAVAAGIVGYAYWQRSRNGGTGEETPVDLSGGDPSIDPYTGVPYSDEYGYGSGGYSGIGIYDPATGQTIGTGYGQIIQQVSSNAAWTQAVIAYMTSVGYEGSVVSSAVGKALTGQALTQDELNIFNAARAIQGEPPNGYPPVHMVSTQPPGTTNGPVGAVTGLTAVPFREHVDLDWQPVAGVDGYTIWANGVRKTSNFFSNEHVWNLKPNTTYKLEVAAFRESGGQYTYGPRAAVTARTKK